MCGIAGIISFVNDPDTSGKHHRDIRKMTASQAHRGPDGEGHWSNSATTVFLGHRRLAVIDISADAAQPMHSADRYSIVYNGEIYNYPELRNDLGSLGYSFKTASDTEVILAAYQQYGNKCLQYFDGMFAFAIWDEALQQLFIARDRFGEKPFFYFYDEQRFLFSSEMKALWTAGVEKRIDPKHSLLYLNTGLSSFPLLQEETFYKNIFQLPAASYGYVELNGDEISFVQQRYWDIDKEQTTSVSEQEAVEKLNYLLTESIRKRLRSDVPLGSSLSGGLDSSTIATTINSLNGACLRTFSAIFSGFEKDESTSIAAIIENAKVDNVQVSPTADDLLKTFDDLLWHQEQPLNSSSAFVQFKVYELAKQNGITVLLDGQGADEILGGYGQYIHWHLQELWHKREWKAQKKELRLFRQHGWEIDWGIKNYLAAALPHMAAEKLSRRLQNKVCFNPFITREYAETEFPEEAFYKPMVNSLNDILYFDTMMGKLPELLRYADRNSMAHGRELRLPFLQHDLVQYIFSLPSSLKLRNGFTKFLLRSMVQDRLPASVSWQHGKIAFEPPQKKWMNEPMIQERIKLSRQLLVDKNILNRKILSAPLHAADANDSRNFDWRCWVLAALSE